MADEEKNETTEEHKDAPEQAEAQPAAEAPADEAPKDEAPKDEAPNEDGPEAPGDDSDEGLDWKARRRLARSRESGKAGPQRSAEERQAERDERRKLARAERSNYRKRARTKHEPGTGTPRAEKVSVARKVRQGTVVSSKPDKTITVRIDVTRRHPVYEKVVRQTGTLHAHDERNEAGDGDLVRIVETRPISKLKRWRLEQILEKAK